MFAYNKTTLYNLHVREEALEALRNKCITAEEYKSIAENHAVDLYTPNLFVKIGLGFLTLFVIIFGIGLLGLAFNVFSGSISGFIMICGLLCYVALEIMVSRNKHFNSGVDSILSIATIVLLLTAISFWLFPDNSYSTFYLLIFIICLWLAYRFVDSLLSIFATVSFILLLFFMYAKLGLIAAATFPVLIMLAALILYYFFKKASSRPAAIYYGDAFKASSVVTLLILYAAGNFYVVNEISGQQFGYKIAPVAAYFYWAFTMVIPALYIIAGLRNRNITVARIGVLLIPVSIVTFRHYYALLAAEAAMTIAGVILITASYLLIRYLRSPKNDYTFEADKPQSDLKNLEGFIIGEAFGTRHQQQPDTKFGGGSFGGGGAGDSY